MSQNPLDNPFPDFPEDIIQGPAREFVDLMSPIRESPPQAFWLSFITLLGNAVSPFVSNQLISSQPRFYSVLLGSSAKTRKSTANNTSRNLIREAIDMKIIEGFGSTEGLLEPLSFDNVCTLMLDEFNMLARKTGQDGTVGISALNALLESHDYDHPRASNPITIRNAHFSMLGASTLVDFVDTWKEHHVNTGFINRLLVVGANAPTKRIPLPVEPDRGKWKALVTQVKLLHGTLKDRKPKYPISEVAEKIWNEFYEDAIGDEPEWDRIDMYGRRLMTMQTLLKGDEHVTGESVREVIKFLNYEVAVRQIVNPEIADNPQAKAQQRILKALKRRSPQTQSELYKAVHGERMGTGVLAQALSGAVNMKLIARDSLGRYLLPQDEPQPYPKIMGQSTTHESPSFTGVTVN